MFLRNASSYGYVLVGLKILCSVGKALALPLVHLNWIPVTLQDLLNVACDMISRHWHRIKPGILLGITQKSKSKNDSNVQLVLHVDPSKWNDSDPNGLVPHTQPMWFSPLGLPLLIGFIVDPDVLEWHATWYHRRIWQMIHLHALPCIQPEAEETNCYYPDSSHAQDGLGLVSSKCSRWDQSDSKACRVLAWCVSHLSLIPGTRSDPWLKIQYVPSKTEMKPNNLGQ